MFLERTQNTWTQPSQAQEEQKDLNGAQLEQY